MQRETVVGVFSDRMQAQRAIEALKAAGFRGEDIGILMQNKDGAKDLASDTGTKAGAGAAAGATTGGLLGALGGLLVGLGALAIPGIGPVLAAGPLVAALGPLVGGVATGAALGAGTGALAGALIGLGIPDDEAHIYEERFNQGRILVTVKAGTGRYGEAEQILRQAGAEDISMSNTGGSMAGNRMSSTTTTSGAHDHGSHTASTGHTAATQAAATATTANMGSDTLRVPVVEETLTAQKSARQAGEVEIGKHVVEQQVNIPVEVSHEEVTVTRHAVDRPVNAGDQTLQDDQVIRVPISEETVQVQKHAHVTEEIEINKQRVSEQRNVSDTVRKEVVDVNTAGQLDAHGGQTTQTTHTDTHTGGGHNAHNH